MEVQNTGITAHLTEEDINEAVVDWMGNHGYAVEAQEIAYTMGRNPKALKATIITGSGTEAKEAPAPKETAKAAKDEPAEKAPDPTPEPEEEEATSESIFGSDDDDRDPMEAAAADDVDTSSDNAGTASIFD